MYVHKLEKTLLNSEMQERFGMYRLKTIEGCNIILFSKPEIIMWQFITYKLNYYRNVKHVFAIIDFGFY